MATLQFTEEQARRLEILYSTPDVRGQREEALRRLALGPGEHVIDIGCGPGYLSESAADAVSAKGRVVGIDISDDLLEFARRRNERSWLMYRKGDAMALPEPDASFDVAVSMQVLDYISDADQGMREMFRVLKPGGRALAVATDWDGVLWHALDADRMRRVLLAWEAHCTDPRLPRTIIPRLEATGFSVTAVGRYPIINTRLGEDAYSDGLSRLIADFARRQKSLPEEEIPAWADEQHTLSAEGWYFFSTMRFFFLATKPRP